MTNMPQEAARPPKPASGSIPCLGGCGKPFKSPDTQRNRVCPRCNTRNSLLSRRAAYAPNRSGAPTPYEAPAD